MKTRLSYKLGNSCKITIGPDVDDNVFVRFEESGAAVVIVMNKIQADRLKVMLGD